MMVVEGEEIECVKEERNNILLLESLLYADNQECSRRSVHYYNL